MRRTAKTSVRSEEHGKPLLELLVSRFTYRTGEEWKQFIREGRLLVNDAVAAAGHKLSRRDRVEFLVPELPEPPVDLDYEVLFEDDSLLVINKPGNLPCHPAGRFFAHTLWALLREKPGLSHFEFVNRLDRETSGVILLAKTPSAARLCRQQFAKRRVMKRYTVLVEGEFPEKLEAKGILVADTGSPVNKKRRFISGDKFDSAMQGSQSAETLFRRVCFSAGISRLDALPHTGRHHQIRASLCSLGFPVVGDKIYGVDDTVFLRFISGEMTVKDRGNLRMRRQALHSRSLAFRHPVSRRTVTFEAPDPFAGFPFDISQGRGSENL